MARQGQWSYKGETKSLTQLALDHNLAPSTVRNRILNGWSLHNALTTPAATTNKKLKNFNQSSNLGGINDIK